MDALQTSDSKAHDRLIDFLLVAITPIIYVVGGAVVGCIFGGLYSFVVATGPLSLVEAWDQQGIVIAIVSGIVSLVVCSGLTLMHVFDLFMDDQKAVEEVGRNR